MKTRVSIAVSAVAFVLATGCAGKQVTKVDELTSAHVFRQPLEEIWPQVRTLLNEKGYEDSTLEISPTSDRHIFRMTTPFIAERSSPTSSHEVRYVVVGKKLAGNHCIVRVIRVDRTEGVVQRGGPPGGVWTNAFAGRSAQAPLPKVKPDVAVRDLKMEWQLLQRADSVAAGRIQAEASSG